MMRTGEGVQSRRMAMPGLSFLEASLRDPSGCAKETSGNLRLQTIAIAMRALLERVQCFMAGRDCVRFTLPNTNRASSKSPILIVQSNSAPKTRWLFPRAMCHAFIDFQILFSVTAR
jgi:hypothetical protein